MEAKERILLKAHELFNRYGIRSVSMNDIAAQLGMSKKTLYQYCTDKDELVNAVFTSVMEQNRTQCSIDYQHSENAIHELFLAFDRMQAMFANMNVSTLFDMEKYHPSAFAKFKEFRDTFLYGVIKANIERGIREEVYRPEIDADVITRYRLYTIMLSFNPEFFPNNRTHLIHIEQQLSEHYLYGLATAKGQKLILKYKSQRTKINIR